MNKSRLALLITLTITAAIFRVLPHPPNFSPIAALALFGGAHFADKRAAFLVPLTAMFLSDLALGLHELIPVIYGCFVLIVGLGLVLRRYRSPTWVVGLSVTASVLFFVITNFAVWASSGMYPRNGTGLLACYVAALPFFGNTVAGDLLFSSALFGVQALAEWRVPRLRESVLA
jgi:hypothetical protein